MDKTIDNLYTIDYIYSLPDGERAELIDGQIYQIQLPSRTHQRLLSKLIFLISNYIDSHSGSCEVYPAPFAVFLNNDEHTYVEPDISVICDKHKLDEKGCHGIYLRRWMGTQPVFLQRWNSGAHISRLAYHSKWSALKVFSQSCFHKNTPFCTIQRMCRKGYSFISMSY